MAKKNKAQKTKIGSVPKASSEVTKKAKKRKLPSLSFKQAGIYLAIFILISFLLYFQCLLYVYVLDDKIVITENNFVKKGFAGIWEILSTDSFQGYFGEQKKPITGWQIPTFINYYLCHRIPILWIKQQNKPPH